MHGYTIDNFDFQFYIDIHLDLRENGIVTKEQAWVHWTVYGHLEEHRQHRLLKPRSSLITDHIKAQEINSNKIDVKGVGKAGIIVRAGNTNDITENDITLIDTYCDAGIIVYNSKYPVIEGRRVAENTDATQEQYQSAASYSGLTSTRVSTKYGVSEMKAGFGTDVSFQITDANGDTNELGVIGMVKSGELSESGHIKGDVIFNSIGGDFDDYHKKSAEGHYETVRITHDGNLLVKKGQIMVNGEQGIKIGNTVLTESKLRSFLALIEQVPCLIIIDVRDREDMLGGDNKTGYNTGHICCAISVPIAELTDWLEKNKDSYQTNQPFYTYCYTGNRAGRAKDEMIAAGFFNTKNGGGYFVEADRKVLNELCEAQKKCQDK